MESPSRIGYSARQWAKRLGKKDTTILGWIRRGLPAANTAPPGSRRKSWLILESDMLLWLKQQQIVTKSKPTVRKSRRSREQAALIRRYFGDE